MMNNTQRMRESRAPLWIWIVYLLVLAASVPWYQSSGDIVRIWLGLPHWVVISYSAYLALAALIVFIASRYWPEPPGDAGSDGSGVEN